MLVRQQALPADNMQTAVDTEHAFDRDLSLIQELTRLHGRLTLLTLALRLRFVDPRISRGLNAPRLRTVKWGRAMLLLYEPAQ
jgi:hypothetical protein